MYIMLGSLPYPDAPVLLPHRAFFDALYSCVIAFSWSTLLLPHRTFLMRFALPRHCLMTDQHQVYTQPSGILSVCPHVSLCGP